MNIYAASPRFMPINRPRFGSLDKLEALQVQETATFDLNEAIVPGFTRLDLLKAIFDMELNPVDPTKYGPMMHHRDSSDKRILGSFPQSSQENAKTILESMADAGFTVREGEGFKGNKNISSYLSRTGLQTLLDQGKITQEEHQAFRTYYRGRIYNPGDI